LSSAAVAASFGDLHSTFEGMRQSNNVDKIGKPVSDKPKFLLLLLLGGYQAPMMYYNTF